MGVKDTIDNIRRKGWCTNCPKRIPFNISGTKYCGKKCRNEKTRERRQNMKITTVTIPFDMWVNVLEARLDSMSKKLRKKFSSK